MEDVLDVYHRPYNPHRPLLCMDEQPVQLIQETRVPQPMQPGVPAHYDFEYERHGTAAIFLFTEPLKGWREANVTEHRTGVDWAHQIRHLLDVHYPDAEAICLVMDNLNTHRVASLYEAFPPQEARRLASKLDIHYTPKHGSWLNMAEIELSALTRQCLDRRIPDIQTMRSEVVSWQLDRNANQTGVNWHFTTDDARIKLNKLYPQYHT